MKKYLSKSAAILAAIIGGMAVFAGGKVLLGQVPDYYVIGWLPVYNFCLGVISLVITSVLIWKSHRLTALAAGATLGAHSIVMILIRSVYQDVVAPDSLRAMTVRIIAWMIIIALISPQWWGEKRTEPGPSAR